ncbi:MULTISPECIES: hypothetical protein [unclassified Streptomyces]|nr:hypothetical protein [Streptomyces sp. NBC_00562]
MSRSVTAFCTTGSDVSGATVSVYRPVSETVSWTQAATTPGV